MPDIPVHHKLNRPTPLERLVQDSIEWLMACFAYPFRGTHLEYWLLHPRGQAYTLFMTTLVGVSIWLLLLNQRSKAILALESTHNLPIEDMMEWNDIDCDEPRPTSPGLSSPPREESPIMRRLAPPDHRPINARLKGSPFRLALPLGPRAGNSVLPAHQTCFADMFRGSKAFSTRPVQHENLPDVAKDAPISYTTLRETILSKEKPVVAHWSNEATQKNGRAMLRRELDDEDLA